MIHYIKIKAGEKQEKSQLIADLLSLHYRRIDYVERPGDFSVRGLVLDIFPLTYQSPLRINFHLDCIENIRDFSIADGKIGIEYADLTILKLNPVFKRKVQRAQKKLNEYVPLGDFYEVRQGDHVVHLDYGIGLYRGARRIKVKGILKKHWVVEFADEELLYLDSDEKHILQRYVGLEGRAPKLSKLHSKDWEKIKEKTRRAVRNVAQDLLTLQAKRNQLRGFSFSPDTDWQAEFEKQFPFKETEDQLKAINDIKQDMECDQPMDRLLCGDVGYGKTEVALRAAFKAVMDDKQVAILVPTTILSEQHEIVLKKRLASFPVRVTSLSRFKTPSEQKEIVGKLSRGELDIVVGTHRLLSKDVQFKKLGLVIIDEEQRFGVIHKERFKRMREMVDVLTLSATPIPRTLHMALIGVRDMSVITTPPRGRLPIKTEVTPFNTKIIRHAFERELDRGGQIFFVHNRVQSIDRIYRQLVKLFPEVRFAVGHGKIPAAELEKIMKSFMGGEIDCLISTNIIESGLDIPNANTMLIDRADMFGLGELYQLRGRVGRSSDRQAFAYFLIPDGYILNEDAARRIHAIEKFTELGSGFRVAMEDLEIRGAGNILGEQQSGYIYQIGMDFYCRLLQEAVRKAEIEQKNSKQLI